MIMDDENIQRIVPREVLVKQGIAAVVSLAGGVFLMLMTVGARFGLLGIAVSVAALVIGLGALFSREREDRKPGLIITAAGVLGLIMRFGLPILKPFAATILIAGSLSLFASGIWKGIKFLIGLNSRR